MADPTELDLDQQRALNEIGAMYEDALKATLRIMGELAVETSGTNDPDEFENRMGTLGMHWDDFLALLRTRRVLLEKESPVSLPELSSAPEHQPFDWRPMFNETGVDTAELATASPKASETKVTIKDGVTEYHDVVNGVKVDIKVSDEKIEIGEKVIEIKNFKIRHRVKELITLFIGHHGEPLRIEEIVNLGYGGTAAEFYKFRWVYNALKAISSYLGCELTVDTPIQKGDQSWLQGNWFGIGVTKEAIVEKFSRQNLLPVPGFDGAERSDDQGLEIRETAAKQVAPIPEAQSEDLRPREVLAQLTSFTPVEATLARYADSLGTEKIYLDDLERNCVPWPVVRIQAALESIELKCKEAGLKTRFLFSSDKAYGGEVNRRFVYINWGRVD